MRRNQLFFALCLFLPSALFAADVCVEDPNAACPSNETTKYCMNVKDHSGMICPPSVPVENRYVAKILSYTVAPPIADVQAVCDFESGHYRCEAWGQGPDVSYTWALNSRPGLSFITPPHGDKVAYINCQPNATNLVYLTVTSKFGLSTTVSTNLYCGYMGEY